MTVTTPDAPISVAHPATDSRTDIAGAISIARAAQRAWRATPLQDRLKVVRVFRSALAASPEPWAQDIASAGLRNIAEALATEVVPLADACRFLERSAPGLLRDRRLSTAARPFWCRSVEVTTRREPWGLVLLVGPGNYPLFLIATQALQALVAGNAVLLKPAPGWEVCCDRLVDALEGAGLPAGLVWVLDADPQSVRSALEVGIDKIVLTGGAAAGVAVLKLAAETITPSAMELSGCDAAWVLQGADLDRAARAIALSATLNGGATCIAPHRVFVDAPLADGFQQRLAPLLRSVPPVRVPPAIVAQAEHLIEDALARGAQMIVPDPAEPATGGDRFRPVLLRYDGGDLDLQAADLFAPVLTLTAVRSAQERQAWTRRSPYALGLSVFGPAEVAAREARQAPAGSVTVNDAVVPTGDPRFPFAGWGKSGFGVTRGAEGLLEMTRLQAIAHQRGSWLPHLDPPREGLDRLLAGYLEMSHSSSLSGKWRGLRRVIAALRIKQPAPAAPPLNTSQQNKHDG